MKKKKISILCPNMSTNCLGRAYILADSIKKDFEVEIIGPQYGKDIWSPCDNKTIKYKTFPGPSLPWLLLQIPKWLKLIDGGIIYASKPHLTSFGIGLLKQRISQKPLVLDIDDWELGAFLDIPAKKRRLKMISKIFFPLSYLWIKIMEKLIPKADKRTVASRFLQRKYGGILVPHGRDTDYLDPKKFDKAKSKAMLGLKNKKIVMFLGTPRKHKGVPDLLEATRNLKEIKTVIVGVDENEFSQKIQEKYHQAKYVGRVPFKKIPIYIAAADIVVIPQKEQKLISKAQVPAKIFDAMSMAKPIIATDVGDLRKILKNSGKIIPSSSPKELKKAILSLIKKPKEMKKLGKRARKECVNKYSYNFMRRKLKQIFNQIP